MKEYYICGKCNQTNRDWDCPRCESGTKKRDVELYTGSNIVKMKGDFTIDELRKIADQHEKEFLESKESLKNWSGVNTTSTNGYGQ